jgi:two-component system OmpR family sensor kinase
MALRLRTALRTRIALTLGLFAALGAAAAGATVFLLPHLKRFGLEAELRLPLAAGVVVAIGVVAWLVGRVAAKRFVAPLERLGVSATAFAAGSHSTRAETDGPRETRIVAEAFNQMAGQIDDALDELKREERRKTQFVSDVSHELRTPLTAIRGAAETLLDGDVEPDDQQRFLSTIALEAERLGRLANDLLTLQRIEGATGELPIHPVDLRLSADRAAAMLEPLLEDREVTLTVNGSAPIVLGDTDRLQQVVSNLIDNASRIVGPGGHVRVELSAEGDRSVLSVIDDGPGIPEADLPRLFDRFYRADSSRTRSSGGAGLGLAIVRAIVTAHGGRIEAANLPEGGARMTVRLPSLRDAEKPPPEND